MISYTKNRLLWLLGISVAAAMLVFSYNYFPQAFPILAINITTNRQDIEQLGKKLAEELHAGPAEYKQAISFQTDTLTQTFVELEGGGKQVFKNIVDQHLYEAHQWSVRHFQEYNAHELLLFFTPQGKPYGYKEIIPETTLFPSLSPQEALKLVEPQALLFGHALTTYALIESSSTTTPQGRTDHTFVYERPDISIKEGRYRLKIIVSGDRVTAVLPFVKVPEAFTRRYQHMRAFNNTLAMIANFLMMFIYVLCGCGVGLFFLLRKEYVLVLPALKWGFGIALCLALLQFNQLPILWMQYNTAYSIANFISGLFTNALSSFLYQGIFFSLIIMAAESLGRKAFGHHPQLWSLYKPTVASSYQVSSSVFAAYLLPAIHLGFTIFFYYISSYIPGWWWPSSPLIDPNVLAQYIPWLGALAISVQAGFIEECLFRAIPLSCAMLLSKKIGHQKTLLIITFIVQALIFGAVHANYPAQPFYARVIELIVPSTLLGITYLLGGLLPAAISHILYDLLLFSMPLFINTSQGAVYNKVAIIISGLVPLIWIVIARLRTGSFHILATSFYNNAWQPMQRTQESITILPSIHTHTVAQQKNWLLLGVCALMMWLWYTPFSHHGLPIKNATLATNVENLPFFRPLEWRSFKNIVIPYQENSNDLLAHQFVWQKSNPKIYKKLLKQTYLHPAHYAQRYATFSGDVVDRAQQYYIHFHPSQPKVMQTQTLLPESFASEQLIVEQARILAYQELQSTYQLTREQVEEVETTSTQHPARRDWNFTFFVPKDYNVDNAQARIYITIGGNRVINSFRFIHIPQEWERTQKNKLFIKQLITNMASLIFIIFIIIAAIIAFSTYRFTLFSLKQYLIYCVAFFLLYLFPTITQLPFLTYTFNTSEPYITQLSLIIGASGLFILLRVILFAFLALYIMQFKQGRTITRQWSSYALGVSVGLIISALYSALLYYLPSPEPLLPSYNVLSSTLPLVYIAGTYVRNYIIYTLFALLILSIAPTFNRHHLLITPFFFILIVASALNILGITTPVNWIIESTILGIVIALLYYLILRHDHHLIIGSIATLFALYAAQQGAFNAFGGALYAYLITVSLLGLLSYGWFAATKPNI